MCGISGIVSQNSESMMKDEIERMSSLIAHRGPDGEGFYYKENFALAHRRLSVIDLSSDGQQPMHYLKKYTITYNGEVYNYLELKKELIVKGYKFHSQSDTEVILASYDMWGEFCVEKFNGMWAFCIYDSVKNLFFCSRDRFGIKPFYYTQIEEKFIFGSEIKQLLEFYDECYVNENILIDYLVIGYEDHKNETFFENIFKLEPSHNLIYNLDTNKFEIKKYYDIKIDETISKLDESSSVKYFKQKLEESIKLRLRSDVKIGSCLSGGLDSSSITAIAEKYYKSSDKFSAIHAKSTEKFNDESSFAQSVANHCNINLHIVEPSREDFVNSIDELIYTQEEPFGGPSIFMQYFVMKKAKEINCTVLLDGQGGDETLLGYERYYPAYLKSLTLLDALKEFYQSSKNSKLSLKKLLQYYIYFTKSNIRIKRLKRKNHFIKEKYLNKIDENIIHNNAENYLNIINLQKNELLVTQLPHLLRYEDKNSMRHSIETRLPFIDYTLVQSALSLNNSLKVKRGWSKYILRKVVSSSLPSKIVWRKNKFGFEAPTKSWLACIANEMEKSVITSKIIGTICTNIDYSTLDDKQRWRLFNIAKWEEIYSVRIKDN